jgi:hypothetical protein
MLWTDNGAISLVMAAPGDALGQSAVLVRSVGGFRISKALIKVLFTTGCGGEW